MPDDTRRTDDDARRTLVIPARTVAAMQETLLNEDGLERFGIVFCGKSNDRLLAGEFHPVPDEAHAQQSTGGCRPEIDVEIERVTECMNEDKVPILVHSHPFSDGDAYFSGRDREMFERMTDWHAGAFPDAEVRPRFAVIDWGSIDAAVYDLEAEAVRHVPIEVLGDWTLESSPTPLTTPDDKLPSIDAERADRTIRAISEPGQRRLAGTRVGVVSAGGIGSVLIEQLARQGVQELVVVDPDIVEESNLSRLAGAYHADVGLPKVDVARRHVAKIDPSIDVRTFQQRAQDVSEMLTQCDLLVAGVDRMSARMWLNEFAVKHLVPLFDAGSLVALDDDGEHVEGFEGYIQTIIPGATACFDCLDRSDPEQARIESLPQEELEREVDEGYVDEGALTPEPAVMTLNGVVASKTVEMVVKHVTGLDEPAGFVRYDGIANDFDAIQTSPFSGCVTCDEDGVFGRGHSLPFDNVGTASGASDTADLFEDADSVSEVDDTHPSGGDDLPRWPISDGDEAEGAAADNAATSERSWRGRLVSAIKYPATVVPLWGLWR